MLNLPINNSSLIETSLKSIYNYKTSFFVPKKGKKLDIVNYASRNSELALKNHIAQSHSDKENLSQLSKVLNISKKIKRVEAYDNSHLSGKNAAVSYTHLTLPTKA